MSQRVRFCSLCPQTNTDRLDVAFEGKLKGHANLGRWERRCCRKMRVVNNIDLILVGSASVTGLTRERKYEWGWRCVDRPWRVGSISTFNAFFLYRVCICLSSITGFHLLCEHREMVMDKRSHRCKTAKVFQVFESPLSFGWPSYPAVKSSGRGRHHAYGPLIAPKKIVGV